MNAVDTNIWIYCHDNRDDAKHHTARRLISTLDSIALLWQVGCEFIAAARKLAPQGFRVQDAWDALADMQAMAGAVLLPNCGTWSIARDIQERRQIHFWDALIVAACVQGGVETLYSEDFGDEDFVEGLRIINPFAGP